MSLRLLLLCHGATAATRAAAFPDDEGLDPTALHTLRFAPALRPRPTRVVASPARRALETAAALGLEAAGEPALRDLDYGRWRGLTPDAVQQRDPEGFEAWRGDPGSAPHGGEPLDALLWRVAAWLDRQVDAGGGTLAAVTHAAVIRAALVHALGTPPAAFWRIDVAPLTVVRLSGGPSGWRLQGMERLDRGPEAPSRPA